MGAMTGRAWPWLWAALACVAACGFSTRSGDYRCEPDGDCDDDRECVDGWCVEPGAVPAVDADVGPFTCNGVSCTLECGPDDCGEPIVCPANRACTVSCTGSDSCGASIDCSLAASCDIECSGPGSCGGPIECGDGSCRVSCEGEDSCSDDVDCDDACACDLDCSGGGSCAGSNECPFNQCTDGNECLVNASNCDRC